MIIDTTIWATTMKTMFYKVLNVKKIPLVRVGFLLVKVVFCILKHLKLLSWGVWFDGFFTDK